MTSAAGNVGSASTPPATRTGCRSPSPGRSRSAAAARPRTARGRPPASVEAGRGGSTSRSPRHAHLAQHERRRHVHERTGHDDAGEQADPDVDQLDRPDLEQPRHPPPGSRSTRRRGSGSDHDLPATTSARTACARPRPTGPASSARPSIRPPTTAVASVRASTLATSYPSTAGTAASAIQPSTGVGGAEGSNSGHPAIACDARSPRTARRDADDDPDVERRQRSPASPGTGGRRAADQRPDVGRDRQHLGGTPAAGQRRRARRPTAGAASGPMNGRRTYRHARVQGRRRCPAAPAGSSASTGRRAAVRPAPGAARPRRGARPAVRPRRCRRTGSRTRGRRPRTGIAPAAPRRARRPRPARAPA